MKNVVLVLALLILAVSCKLEKVNSINGGVGIDFTRTYGDIFSDIGNSVQQTNDGGFIIAGMADYLIGFNGEIYVLKTDSRGNVKWDLRIGSIYLDEAFDVQQTSDNGYIVAATTHSYGRNGDAYLVKVSKNGFIQWTRSFGGSNSDGAYSVQQTSDNRFIFVGFTKSTGNGGKDVYLVKTDVRGNAQWYKTFGGNGNDIGWSIEKTQDGGFVIAGETMSSGNGDVYLIKTDANGNEEWQKTFGGSGLDRAFDVKQTPDGGFVIVGETQSFARGLSDVYLIKTDSHGNEEWHRTLGGNGTDVGKSIQVTDDGGFIITGYSNSYSRNISDVYVVKTDENGHEEWHRIFGRRSVNHGNSIDITDDGGFVIVGCIGCGDWGGDIYLIKLFNFSD